MEAKKKIDTSQMEERITSLQKNLSFLNSGSGSGANDLFTIIHRPGWTTILQVAFAVQILDAMNHQATALHSLKETLQKHVEASTGH